MAVNLLFAQLTPLVLNKDAPVAPKLEIHFDATPSSAKFHLDATNADLALTPDASGKVFSATVPTAAFLTGFTDANVHRKFLGKLTADAIQAFVFGDVLTAAVPAVSVKSIAADVQSTENLVNIKFPNLADKADDVEPQLPAICQKFYSHFDDDYDFLNIVIARTNYANRHHEVTRVDATGFGAAPKNIDAQFSSAGRLLGITVFPVATMFDGGGKAQCHELGHQWLNQLNFVPMQNVGNHWPLSDLCKDIMGLSLAGDNAGGEFNFDLVLMGSDFKLVPNNQPKKYSDLGLYLMGMIPANQVATHFVFSDQTQKPVGGILHGPVTNITVNDVIAHVGARTPDSTKSQKRFRVATILVTKQSLAPHDTMQLYDFFAKRASAKTQLACTDGFESSTSNPFRLATNGIGRLDPRIKRNILVDASRDGGVWWFPQTAPFNINNLHQGKALADHLRGLGHKVTELGHPATITGALLADFDVVIRAGGLGNYTAAEINAYDAWVKDFGSLLLLVEHHPQDALASHFGLIFKAVVRGKKKLSTFTPHPVTQGVGTLSYPGGSGLTAHPPSAIVLGKLSADSFLDLNDNNKQDAGEPSAPAGLGVMPFGQGRIVFCGDANLWEQVPQPLVKNTLHWLTGP